MFNGVLKSKWSTAAILAILGLLVVSIIKTVPQVVTAVKETKNLNQKIAEAKKTDSELKKLGDYLKSDAYLERQARLKLNYKKPDENVVFVYKNLYNQNPKENDKARSESDQLLQMLGNSLKSLQDWWGSLLSREVREK